MGKIKINIPSILIPIIFIELTILLFSLLNKLFKFNVWINPLKFNTSTISLKLNIRGSNNIPAAAGDGTPSKKFTFQVSSLFIFIKLNLANRRAQQTV